MGLLDRARDSQVQEYSAWEDLIQNLQKLTPGVDYPVVLFQQLTNYLSIQKGALFFRSDRGGLYECLSSRGYDKTTTSRLRMDSNTSDSDDFKEMLAETKCKLSNQGSPHLKEYMSSREFGLIDTIYWLPFFIENNIICVIMISEWKNLVPENWEDLFNRISREFSFNVYSSRKSLMKQDKTSARRLTRDELLKKINSLNMEHVFLIEVDLSPLIKLLMDLKEGLSILNLKKEILSVFRTMAGPEQELIDIEDNKILLILDRQRVPDKSLFIHQLSASLPLLFQDLKTAPVLNTRDFEFPESEDEQEQLIRTLI